MESGSGEVAAEGSRAHARCVVWRATLDALRPAHERLLSPVERSRRSAFRQAADADRFTLARALVRTVLGTAAGTAPGAVRLDNTCAHCGAPHGKPRALDAGAPEFSLSHSGEVVLVATSMAGPVGVDVESAGIAPVGVPEREDTDPDALVATMLAPSERQHLAGVAPTDVSAALLRTWTRKEAVLKATGQGLRIEPADVEVSAPDQPPALVSLPMGGTTLTQTAFTLADVRVPDGYLAAVAIWTPDPVAVESYDAGPLLRG